MTVQEAIAAAEVLLPGRAAPDGRTDPRWQAIIAVGEFIETEPDAVWLFIRRWGGSTNTDLRSAVATCLLEHLLENHFDRFITCRTGGVGGSTIRRYRLPLLEMKRPMLAAVVLLAGCQYNPFAHEFTTRRPVEDSVVGRYSPDDETKERLRTRLKLEVSPGCEFVLNSDKTFVARSLPRCWIKTFECAPGTDDWKGSRALEQQQEWWVVALHITSRTGEPTSYRLPVMIRGEAPPYLLHLTIGDPDSGDALAFQRGPPESR